MNKKELFTTISKIKKPMILGISGFGGSGKSSLAKEICLKFYIPVISIDSFQTKGLYDSKYKLWEIMDFKRLENSVLKPFLNKEKIIRYENFYPNLECITETVILENKGKIIIEGVGLFRPELLKYFTYKIWVDCEMETEIQEEKKGITNMVENLLIICGTLFGCKMIMNILMFLNQKNKRILYMIIIWRNKNLVYT